VKLLAALVLLVATPAIAQLSPSAPPADPSGRTPLPPGQGTESELREREDTSRVRGAVRASNMTEREIRQFTQNYARCAAGRNRELAINAVDQMSSLDQRQRDRLVDPSACFPITTSLDDSYVAQARFPFPTLQLALADALVRDLYAEPGPTEFALIPPQMREPRPPSSDEGSPVTVNAAVPPTPATELSAQWRYIMERFGECVARREPERVRQMAFTEVVSSEERAALQALQPMLGACLPPGSTLRLRPADVRAWSLLAYYRLARAAATAPQGTP
jgi:hypothetical protein